MAGYDINVGRDLLPGLLNGQNGLAKLVETVLNPFLGCPPPEWGVILVEMTARLVIECAPHRNSPV